MARIERTVIAPSEKVNEKLISLGSAPISTGIKLSELLKRPEISYDAIEELDMGRKPLPKRVKETAQILVKYEGYIKREKAEAERKKKLEDKPLSADIDYLNIRGLRLEAAEKLSKIKPVSIGQASRISGVNPADINVLLIYLSHKNSI